MPAKRYNFKHRVQLCPRSHGDILKDDPSESKNVIIPVEPENWKYGIYFTDDYDYSQHLVSMNDFNDESKELNTIDFEKKVNMHPSLITKTATVIKEFNFEDEHNIQEELNQMTDFSNSEDLTKQYDARVIDEFKNIAENELDEDLLYALNNAKCADEMSQDDILDDNFVELADELPNKFKVDREMMARFFGDENNSGNGSQDASQSEDDDDMAFDDDILNAINEIAEKNTVLGESKRLRLSVEGSSKTGITNLSALSILKRSNEQREAKKNATLVNPVPEDMKKYIIYEDVEYNSDEMDAIVDEWAGIKNDENIKEEEPKRKKVNKHIPTMITVPKETKSKRRNKNKDKDSIIEMPRINVSEFHVPRKEKETTEEKKQRKRNIKVAKRISQEEKKEFRNAFKALSK